jgi:integrase
MKKIGALTLRKRGETYHADLYLRRVHLVRGSLGTNHFATARRLVHHLEIALSEGPTSTVWAELHPVVPPATFSSFVKYAGVPERPIATWSELDELFESSGDVVPFTADELGRLEDQARRGPGCLFPFLLARWTGLRCADLVGLRWRDVVFDRKEIQYPSQKNRNQVILSIGTELLPALQVEFRLRSPQPGDSVLLNPETGEAFTWREFWLFTIRLGKRAGVEHALPHRFRVTLALGSSDN